MALSDKDRKRRQREKQRHMGMTVMSLELAAVERTLINLAAAAAGYTDQTEYLLDLVRKDRDTSRQHTKACPDCRGRGCFSCCSTEAEIRIRDQERELQ